MRKAKGDITSEVELLKTEGERLQEQISEERSRYKGVLCQLAKSEDARTKARLTRLLRPECIKDTNNTPEDTGLANPIVNFLRSEVAKVEARTAERERQSRESSLLAGRINGQIKVCLTLLQPLNAELREGV